MYVSSREIKEKMTRKFESQYPDLLLYLDNPYISELVDAILNIVSQEISEIKNEVVLKKDINRGF
ncbi:hypothetical protein NV379_16285 [Paenibacillus sp. N1-5-1-14]|uniref:hypothetical protein n=1 Tax=Paenibacillus radicibacter TaxID=2972488 RepID=UPI002159500B|nr:hypothetical protein [Paenibacillus radicibacter]MCR8644213.1 hypothetical protein [Paenibacillus radicibacter]